MQQHRVELLHRWLSIHKPPELDPIVPRACRCHQRSGRGQPSASSQSDKEAMEIKSAHESNSTVLGGSFVGLREY